MTRLPGYRYEGADPDGFMTKNETIDFLDGYGQSFNAPVNSHVTVEQVIARHPGFEVVTDAGVWSCDVVVAATGASSEPRLPPVVTDVPARIHQFTALQYRNPTQIGEGDVLVVGASASGAQIADELQRSGRRVTIAVGDHIRLPRRYRGRDIHWWMDAIGQLDERYDEVEDLDRARRLPSLQLIGSTNHRTLDLNSLQASGVDVVGKLVRMTETKAQFSGALSNLLANADLKQQRLFDRIDEFATDSGLDDELGVAEGPSPTKLALAPTELDLQRFDTIIWATGYRPSFSWIDPGAFDQRGRLAHDGGVCDLAGLYVIGLPFLRRRKSSFIDGVGPDSAELISHVHAHLDRRVRF